MELQITQRPALIGLEIRDARMSLHQESAKLHLKNARPDMDLKYTSDRLDIDFTRCDEAIGYYRINPFSSKTAEDGHYATLQGIARIVEEGNLMEDIHKNGFIIPYLANRDAWVGRDEVGLGFKPAPSVEYEAGLVTVIPQEKTVQIDVNLGGVNVQTTPGDVSVYLQQNPEFEIEFIGNTLDTFR